VTEDRIVLAAVAGTGVFTVVAAAATVAPDTLDVAAVVVDLVLFGLGCAAFLRGLLLAAQRSRTEELSVGGLWFLSGSAPAGVRRLLLGSLTVQVVVALVTASIRPFTALAFGVLVPVYGLGLAGLWAASRGTFPPRRQRAVRRPRPGP
jgi:hypothetical protein